MQKHEADVCLILEGTYPYVSGGVASWTQDMILSQPDLTFTLFCILPPDAKPKSKFNIPKNVVAIQDIYLQKLPDGEKKPKAFKVDKLFEIIELPIIQLQYNSTLENLEKVTGGIKNSDLHLGTEILLQSPRAWEMAERMYSTTMGDSSFLNFFWSWVGLLGSFYAVMLAEIPKAKTYHALSTGYAGLFLSRVKIETGKSCILTEHGIYTNERRIEIMAASWLNDMRSMNLSVERPIYIRDLKDFWVDTFTGYSKLAYEAADSIITLYEENRNMQVMDGAPVDKIKIIPNGIDVEEYAGIDLNQNEVPTIALIGRIVPIKDVKNFIHSASILKERVPNLRALIMGGWDEDPDYYKECKDFVHSLELEDTVEFLGRVNVKEYLGQVDVLVLTSISEVMPLVVLEGGAAGIPAVCTNVGACSELIYGRSDESPNLGAGGAVCPLSNPGEIAQQILFLLLNKSERNQRGQNLRNRIKKFYSKDDVDGYYSREYHRLMDVN